CGEFLAVDASRTVRAPVGSNYLPLEHPLRSSSGTMLIAIIGEKMNRTAIPVLIFLAAAVSVHAQQPTPVPLFSAEAIKSFTPSNNPITDAEARLGDMIFDEKRISTDNSVACNTCHSPNNGFTTHTAASRGVGDQIGKRNAPS